MKKNNLLLLVFLLLAGGTAAYFLTKKQGASSTLGWDRNFKVENPDDIHKIFIAKRSGETTTLERQGDHWLYNGKWKANPGVMDNVLEAITKVEMQSVPPVEAVKTLVEELAGRGIKVEIYDKRGKKIKAYYVGGVTSDARGTAMIMENSEQPHIVELPLMEGQIRTRYDLSGDNWRDRSVFQYKPEEVQSVSVEYPLNRSKSFQLTRQGSDFSVKPLNPNTAPIQRPVSEANVETYLTGFENTMAERFNNGYGSKDSIRQNVTPFSIVSITDRKGTELKVAFYPFFKTDPHTGEISLKVVERYSADMSTGDWMMVQHRVFQKIFWAYEGFFAEEPKKVKN